MPMFMRTAIDSLAIKDPDILIPVLGILAVALVRSFISVYSSRMLQRVAISSSYDIRKRFFSHVQRMGSTFFNRFGTGDVMSRSSGDIAMVRRVIVVIYVVFVADTDRVGVAANAPRGIYRRHDVPSAFPYGKRTAPGHG